MQYRFVFAALRCVAVLVGGSSVVANAAVNWQPEASAVPLAFEDSGNWSTSVFDPPAPTPELTPPGSDSVWFVEGYDGTITLTDERTANTTKLGPGRIGGGDANQFTKFIIDADVTITGQERDGTGAVNPNLREFRLGGTDSTPGDANFPLVMLVQRSGHLNLEYETDPNDSDIKLVSDKTNTGGAVWEIGGTSQLTLQEGLLVGEKAGVVSTGGIFRVRGSDVAGVSVGNRMLLLSRTAHWDLTDNGGNKQVNRGKSIAEFVLDADGVTPIEINGDLALGSEFVDIATLNTFVVPAFLRVKLSEPTTAGTGSAEEVLFRADNIGSRITTFPGSQSQDGVFFDPDRDQVNFPHRVIDRLGTGTVISEYAGVTYTWDAVYDDNSLGLDVLEDALKLTNLVISDPGGSGIQGDFDDANGLDANDADALQNAFGTSIAFDGPQHMFDLNADGDIDALDLTQLITHPGLANTSLADFDLDGDADGVDLATLQSGFGTESGALFTDGDAELNGAIGGSDVLAWQRLASQSANSVAAVPEPSCAVLVCLAAVVLALRGGRTSVCI